MNEYKRLIRVIKTATNYTEGDLGYVDGFVSHNGQVCAVCAIIANTKKQHPKGVYIVAPLNHLEIKNMTMTDNIYQNIDELLLQYCANELTQEQRAAVERFIAFNPDYFDVLSGLRRQIRDMGSIEAVREHKAALKERMYQRLFVSKRK